MTKLDPNSGAPEPTLEPVDFDPFADALQDASFPLTEAQRELWAAVQLGPEVSCAYNQCLALTLRGEVSVDALQRSVQQVFDRHESLRTLFDEFGQSQSVRAPEPLTFLVLELSGHPVAERPQRLQEVLDREVGTPLDLVRGPVARVTFLIEAPDLVHLVLTAHHIVFDGHSSDLFFREVAAFYSAERTGSAAQLPPAIPFHRQVELEKSDAGVARAEKDLAFWKAQLSTGASALQLPTDHPGSARPSYRGRRADLLLTRVPRAEVTKVASRLGATSTGLLLSAFQTLLYRLTGQGDVVVGLPVSARPAIEGDSLMGHATNLLATRTRLEANMTFADVVRSTRTTLLDCHDHQAVTFGALLRELKVPRDSGRTPLVSAVFNVGVPSAPVFPGAQAEIRTVARKFVNFDLEMQVVDTRRELMVELAYSTDLLEPETVERWLRHYEQLLSRILVNPDERISELPLLTDDERTQLLVGWNSTQASYPREVPLARLVEEQVARTPDVVAVVCGEDSLTFAELNARANQLARTLVDAGAGPDQVVGLFVERSTNMLVALLAIVKSGAAYLPLDPLLPKDRIQYMLEDSGAFLVLTEIELEETLPSLPGTVISLDEHGWKSNSRENLVVPVEPEHLAYLIYTSGSTGKPKGVEVLRGAFINFLWSMRTWLTLAPEDRWLAVTTISFDIAGLEIWLPLLVGARVVIASRDDASDGTSLCALIEEHDITCLQATPVTWRLLLEAGWKGKGGIQIICGGESLPRDLAVALTPIVRRLWNLYGPTETTVWSTGYQIRDGNQPILIGRPVANTQCYILDENRRPVPVGVVGELYIGGDGLARGYHGRPELTAERFLPDPFSTQPGARMYRTGDLARYLADGNIECLGRTDYQVKIRGYRIELGEIETALVRHPAVNQAVVTTRADSGSGTYLAAYLTCEGDAPTSQELRAHLKHWLPDYMVPQHFLVLPSFPLTPNGKIDRKTLPPPPSLGAPHLEGSPILGPRNDLETRIALIFANVLGLPAVGVDQDFFSLGGASVSAIAACARIERELKMKVSLRSFFETPSVEGIARRRLNLAQVEEPVVVTLQPGQPGRTPLFCIMGIHLYLDLARETTDGTPVIGIHVPIRYLPAKDRYPALAAVAQKYVEVLRRERPTGPYALAGLCYGGLVAYEMAHILSQAGEEVRLLAVFDSILPRGVHTDLVARVASTLVEGVQNPGGAMRKLPGAAARVGGLMLSRFPLTKPSVKRWVQTPENASDKPVDLPIRGPETMAEVRAFEGRAPYTDVPLLVFRALGEPRPSWMKVHSDLGWCGLTRSVRVVDVAGDHMSIMRSPHSRLLASEIMIAMAGPTCPSAS